MMVRPAFAVVHCCRTGHVVQWAPKRAEPFFVIVTVMSSGQVTVRASRSKVKSSRVNPPGTPGRNGGGLITAAMSRSSRCARNSPAL